MRIYILEEYDPSNQLTRYWLFDELKNAQSFVTFCMKPQMSKEGYTYNIKCSDPNDRR
jgi:hypothetical protein